MEAQPEPVRVSAWVRPEFERQQKRAIGLTFVMLALFGALQRITGGMPLMLVLMAFRFVELTLRQTLWKCPNCKVGLPLNSHFNPFTAEIRHCPGCKVRLV